MIVIDPHSLGHLCRPYFKLPLATCIPSLNTLQSPSFYEEPQNVSLPDFIQLQFDAVQQFNVELLFNYIPACAETLDRGWQKNIGSNLNKKLTMRAMVRFQRQTIETGKSKRATLYTVQLRQNKTMLNTFYTDHVCIVCMCKIVHNITYLYEITHCKFSPITYHKFVFFYRWKFDRMFGNCIKFLIPIYLLLRLQIFWGKSVNNKYWWVEIPVPAVS